MMLTSCGNRSRWRLGILRNRGGKIIVGQNNKIVIVQSPSMSDRFRRSSGHDGGVGGGGGIRGWVVMMMMIVLVIMSTIGRARRGRRR